MAQSAQNSKKRSRSGFLDDDTRSYLKGIKNALQTLQGDESEVKENQELLVERVYSELKGKLKEVCMDQKCSKIMEEIIKLSNINLLIEFTRSLSEPFADLFCNSYSSHVLQTLFSSLCASIETHKDALEQLFSSMLEEILPHLDSLVYDANASHVLRSLLQSLQTLKADSLITSFSNKLVELEVDNMAFQTNSCLVLQELIGIQSDPNALFQKLLKVNPKDTSKSQAQLNKMMKDQIASHLLEKLISKCSPELYMMIYTSCYRNKLVQLSLDPISNFSVQQLIANVKDVPQAKMIFDELFPSISELIQNNKTGVVLKLVEMCHKFAVKQKEITKFFRTTYPEDVAKTLLHLGMQKKEGRCSAVGSMLVQALLKYPQEHIKFLIDSFLSLNTEYLVSTACDAAGSRTIECFLQSSVSSTAKQKVIDQFKGQLTKMSHNKYGAHCVESCYKAADISRKELIAKELLASEKQLIASQYGKFVLQTCKVNQLKAKKDLKLIETQNQKKRELFADLLIDNTSSNSSSKQQSSSQPKKKKQKLQLF